MYHRLQQPTSNLGFLIFSVTTNHLRVLMIRNSLYDHHFQTSISKYIIHKQNDNHCFLRLLILISIEIRMSRMIRSLNLINKSLARSCLMLLQRFTYCLFSCPCCHCCCYCNPDIFTAASSAPATPTAFFRLHAERSREGKFKNQYSAHLSCVMLTHLLTHTFYHLKTAIFFFSI